MRFHPDDQKEHSAKSDELTAADSVFLSELSRTGAFSLFQAERLAEYWPDLPEDWASAPALQGVREHTRLYIDLLRQRKEQA